MLIHVIQVLDDRIDDFAEMIREHYNLPGLGDPTSSTEVSESSADIGLMSNSKTNPFPRMNVS